MKCCVYVVLVLSYSLLTSPCRKRVLLARVEMVAGQGRNGVSLVAERRSSGAGAVYRERLGVKALLWFTVIKKGVCRVKESSQMRTTEERRGVRN